ncbi:hypothetical protein [Enterobacter hormaechei]|uniref:hypothetical protein n=1 Tax=Enterobacter hormaechei TaxID=158836 RepID=UPI0012B7D1C4|nr:hypothetical protein [Enterobacter hormaechei]
MTQGINKNSAVIISGKKYKVNQKHRTNKPKVDCTQWIVSETDERSFFGNAIKSQYICSKNCYWWVEATAVTIKPIEIGKTDLNYAFIAKFRSDNNDEWHGYPVTGERAPHDIPPTSVLAKWRELKIFSKKEINDIERGRGYVKNCA